jgi:hypothetical protein
MAQENNASQQLYDLLVTRDFDPKSLDAMGKPTVNPGEADLFSFNFKTENKEYGTVVVLVNGDNDLEVFYGDNLGKAMDSGDKGDWYDFLAAIRNLAKRHLLTFSLNNMNKLKYQMKSMADLAEGLVLEAWKGQGKNKSYNNQPGNAKVVIQHSRAIGEGEQRFRNIGALFVENAQGERFKMPFKSIGGAKAMARHVSEGGNPYDSFGQHISEIVNEINTLGKFIRASRGNQFAQNQQALGIVEDAVNHYAGLKRKAKKMIGKRGYKEIFSTYDPMVVTELDETVEAVREVFVNSAVDSRIEEALPILAKIKENTMREADIFEQWADGLMEGTWQLPSESEETFAKFTELMAQPIKCGPGGEYATEVLYDIFGDDTLFDEIGELGDRDPEADCRDLIRARAEELDIVLPAEAAEVDVEVGESIGEGYTVFPELSDREKKRYRPRDEEGLEGPFRLHSGKFVYYDKKEGKYYDPDTDFFMSDEDYAAHSRSKNEESIVENPTEEEPASGYQAGQQRAAAGKQRSLGMNMGGDDAAAIKTAGGDDIEENYDGPGDKVMFKGREIDTDTIDYDMEDFSDLIFNIDYGVRYTDGSPVDEADYEALTYTDDIMDFVRIDYVESFREGVDNFVNPNDQDGTDDANKISNSEQSDLDSEDMTENEEMEDLLRLAGRGNVNEAKSPPEVINPTKDSSPADLKAAMKYAKYMKAKMDTDKAKATYDKEIAQLEGWMKAKSVTKETQDIDTGKEALKAEREPMLERILQLSKW